MEALRRAIVVFWGLVLAAVAGLIAVALVNHQFAAAAVDFIDRFLVYNLRLCFVEGQMLWVAICAGVVLAILAICSLIIAFKRPRHPRQVHVDASGGNIDISLNAVENVVKRAALQVTDAQNIISKLQMLKDGLHVFLQITVPLGVVIPDTGAKVRQAVAEQLEAMVGIVPKQIKVEVMQVVDKPEEGKTSGAR